MATNLAEGLLAELNRNRELLRAYEEIGPVGAVGALFIRKDIRDGEESMASDDVAGMVRAYAALKENE